MFLRALSGLFFYLLGVFAMADAQEFVKDEKLFDYTPKDQGYHSDNKWSGTDKSLEAAYQILNAIDWAQTRQIARQPEKYSEAGTDQYGSASIIGEHPSRNAVNAWHLVKALGHPAIVNKLSEPWKSIFQALTVGTTGSAVKNNNKIDLDMIRW